MSWLLAIPSKLYIYAGIALAFAAALAKAWSEGGKAARAKQLKVDYEAMTEAQKIDEAIAGNAPDENRKELGKWAK